MPSISGIAHAKVLASRFRKRPGAQKSNLWEEALASLSQDEKDVLSIGISGGSFNPASVLTAIDLKKRECENNRWVLYKKKSGEKVFLRDKIERISHWVNRFKQIGDVAVQFDAQHASLPWAAVRLILQITCNDVQMFGDMIEGVETVARVICRYAEVEKNHLHVDSVFRSQLATVIVNLYTAVLRYLTVSVRFYGRNTLHRIARGAFSDPKAAVSSYLEQIQADEDEAYKLVTFVQADGQREQLRTVQQSLYQALQMLQPDRNKPELTVDERRRLALEWVDAKFTDDTYENILRLRLHGTCDWILERPVFREWAEEPGDKSKLLWIHGPPGFGKTFLSTRILQFLSETEGQGSAYFFCASETEDLRDPFAILRSWIAQLVRMDESAVRIAEQVQSGRMKRDRPPTVPEMWSMFHDMSCQISASFLVDGFDECGATSSTLKYHTNKGRAEFLRTMVHELRETKARVLVMSRDVSDIRDVIGPEAMTDTAVLGTDFKITSQETFNDIQSFSRSVFSEKLPKKSESLRDEIAEEAASKCDGMFLWLHLLRDQVSPVHNRKQLRSVVSEMPSGIDQVYRQELERILGPGVRKDEKERAIEILRWVVFAARPLRVEELVEALLFSSSDSTYPADDLPESWYEDDLDEEYIQDFLRKPCGSLIELRASPDRWQRKKQTVHLVHFSVKEFLLAKADGDVPLPVELRFSVVDENRSLAHMCLRYLCLDDFTNKDRTVTELEELLNLHPFFLYAARFWPHHGSERLNQAQKNLLPESILHSALELYDHPGSTFILYSRVIEQMFRGARGESIDGKRLEQDETDIEGSTILENKVGSPVYYAAARGLFDLLRALIPRNYDLSAVGGQLGFPLQAAASSGCLASVQLLLSSGADINQFGGWWSTALYCAIFRHTSIDMVCALLNADPDLHVDLRRQGYTEYGYMMAACDCEWLDVMKLLHERDPHLLRLHSTTSDEDGAPVSLLQAACRDGREDIVRWLLDVHPFSPGREISAADYYGYWNACSGGHDTILRLLLEAGFDAKRQTPEGCTGLYFATAHGHISCMKLFLEWGVDADSPSNAGVTTLMIARASNSEEVTRLLVDHGANVNAKAKDSLFPLLVASLRRNVEVMKILLEAGADVNAKFEGGSTPLLFACFGSRFEGEESGDVVNEDGDASHKPGDTLDDSQKPSGIDVRVVKLLLEHGADPNISSDDGVTPIMHACEENEEEVVRLLLESGADPNARTAESDPTLIFACGRGHVQITRFLVESGADVNATRTGGVSALVYACVKDTPDLVEILLDNGADMFRPGWLGFVALDLGIARAGSSVVEVLLRHGALRMKNAAERRISHPIPAEKFLEMHLAAVHGDVEKVKVLRKELADDNAQAYSNEMLWLAAGMGNINTVAYLLDQGADVNIQTVSGHTPLMAVYGHVFGDAIWSEDAANKIMNPETTDINETRGSSEEDEMDSLTPSKDGAQRFGAVGKTDRGSRTRKPRDEDLLRTAKVLLRHGADPCLGNDVSGWGPIDTLDMSSRASSFVQVLVEIGPLDIFERWGKGRLSSSLPATRPGRHRSGKEVLRKLVGRWEGTQPPVEEDGGEGDAENDGEEGGERHAKGAEIGDANGDQEIGEEDGWETEEEDCEETDEEDHEETDEEDHEETDEEADAESNEDASGTTSEDSDNDEEEVEGKDPSETFLAGGKLSLSFSTTTAYKDDDRPMFSAHGRMQGAAKDLTVVVYGLVGADGAVRWSHHFDEDGACFCGYLDDTGDALIGQFITRSYDPVTDVTGYRNIPIELRRA